MTKVHFITQGCSANRADSEQMAGLLKEAKFEIIDNLEEADVVIINSCTVKSPTENAFFKQLEEIKEEYPYKMIIIAGCIAQTERKLLKKYSLIGTKQIHNIVEVVEETLNDNVVKMLEMGEMPPLKLPRVRKNPIVEIIPISRGCLGYCTFCKTRSARGNLVSYSIEEIKLQLRKALMQGVKEVWLTSQDCGCYGFDIGTDLADLLEELVRVEGNYRIRIGMMNPDHLLKIKDKLLKVFKSEKIFKFLHLPLQAGNDQVLEDMKRPYKAKDFEDLIKDFRRYFPRITIATDIIVGFPGETEQQYWDTLSMVKRTTPDAINISRFWPRPKTPAAEMKNQVEGGEIKRRSRVLADIFNNIAQMQNEKFLGHEVSVLIDDRGKEESWIGRTNEYKQVVLKGEFTLGQRVKVRVKNIGPWDLRGDVVD
ncbi:tRNA (N(6)-L-threonylcarbamoyladenosine(37)-C(2))-methylthiotransferase [Candidatus Woesearchaeota archaeon]|jgi:threonylcarbamoyladenosine tRNA methylthiotransferase CDKAL1|nr:tRNA (N(6)-L-threonylcarbamoyladenosine(37)-C(2))-methylthiotransferase [Candidatus Woesearchaeota archaeon]